MLASSCYLGIAAGWLAVIFRGPCTVHSLASDVKSFCVCFGCWIVPAELKDVRHKTQTILRQAEGNTLFAEIPKEK